MSLLRPSNPDERESRNSLAKGLAVCVLGTACGIAWFAIDGKEAKKASIMGQAEDSVRNTLLQENPNSTISCESKYWTVTCDVSQGRNDTHAKVVECTMVRAGKDERIRCVESPAIIIRKPEDASQQK